MTTSFNPQALELPALRLALRVAELGGVAAAAREQHLLRSEEHTSELQSH